MTHLTSVGSTKHNISFLGVLEDQVKSNNQSFIGNVSNIGSEQINKVMKYVALQFFEQ